MDKPYMSLTSSGFGKYADESLHVHIIVKNDCLCLEIIELGSATTKSTRLRLNSRNVQVMKTNDECKMSI